MSSVYQRLMSDGQWELTLKADTPRAVLEKLAPFNVHVVVTPSEIDVGSSDAVFLAAARYVGPIRRLGTNRLNPGGPGNAMWLSDPDGKGEIIESAISSATGTLSSWVTALLPTSINSGSVTSPGGTFTNTYQYVSRRDAINSVCRGFGVEWRVNNDFTFDVGTAADLYRNVAGGDTPAVTVARGFGGRDPQVVGIRSSVETDVDWLDFVNDVIVLGQEVGDAAGTPVFRKPHGPLLDWQRVVVDPSAPLGYASGVALAIRETLPHTAAGRREVRVSTDVFDVAGDVTLGDDVYVWDPENGLRDTGNQVTFQGQLIYPTVMRCVGMKWPIRRGMGVYLRVTNGVAPFDPTYENITNYVEFEDGAAELELSTASRPLRVDQYGQLTEASAPVQQTPWQEYTPTLGGAALGAGTAHGFYRRQGTTLHLRVRVTFGAGMSVTGPVAVSLPSGVTAVTETDGFQLLPAILRDTGTTVYHGIGQVTTGASTVVIYAQGAGGTWLTQNAVATSVPHTWASTDVITLNGTIEVDP